MKRALTMPALSGYTDFKTEKNYSTLNVAFNSPLKQIIERLVKIFTDFVFCSSVLSRENQFWRYNGSYRLIIRIENVSYVPPK